MMENNKELKKFFAKKKKETEKFRTLNDIKEYRRNPDYESSYYIEESEYKKGWQSDGDECLADVESLKESAKEWIKYYKKKALKCEKEKLTSEYMRFVRFYQGQASALMNFFNLSEDEI